MFCSNCGSKIPDNSAFCPACGMKQTQQSQPRPQQQSSQQHSGQQPRSQQGQPRPQQGQPRPHQSQPRPQQARRPEPEDQTPYIKIMVIAIVCIFAALLFVLGFMFVYNKFIIKDDEEQSYDTQTSDTLLQDNSDDQTLDSQINDDISTDDKSDKDADKQEDKKDDKSEDDKKNSDTYYDLDDRSNFNFYGDIDEDDEGNYILRFFDKRTFVQGDKKVEDTSYIALDLTDWDYDLDDYPDVVSVEVTGNAYISGDEVYFKVKNIYTENGDDITEKKSSDGDYILPNSDSEVLTLDDIKGLSLKEVNYAKNEIYARHGRKFKSKELNDYFNSKSWYKGTIDPGDFNESSLSSTESKNVKLLSDREFSLDPNGYKLDQ